MARQKDRKARLAAALRENLRKRKGQRRERADVADAASPGAAEGGGRSDPSAPPGEDDAAGPAPRRSRTEDG